LRLILGWAAGLAVLAGLAAFHDLEAVFWLLAEGGVPIFTVCLFAAVLWLAGTVSWRLLFQPSVRPPFRRALSGTIAASAANALLPVLAVGGEALKVHHVVKRGTPGPDATAAALADIAVQALVALLWALTGVAILSQVAADSALTRGALTGLVLLGCGIGAFIALQVMGTASFAARRAARLLRQPGWDAVVSTVEEVDDKLRAIYRRAWPIAAAGAVRYLGRATLVLEILLAGFFLGGNVDPLHAVMIAGLVYAVRAISFAVPARMGFQEGGFVAAGAMVGQPAELMLAIALAVRLRETLPHLPVLAVWYRHEALPHWGRLRRPRNDARRTNPNGVGHPAN